MRWVLDHFENEAALRMAALLASFWIIYGHTTEGLSWLREVLAASEDILSNRRAAVLIGAGWLEYQLGNLHEARAALESAVRVADACNASGQANRAKGGLAFVLFDLGKRRSAIELAEEVVLYCRDSSDETALARALTRLAELHVLQGEADDAAPLALEAIRVAKRAPDPQSHAGALDIVAMAELLRGSAEAAVELMQESVRLHREVGWVATIAGALIRWAQALVAIGDFDGASAHLSEAIGLAQSAASSRRIADALRVASTIACARRDYSEAVRLCAATQTAYAKLSVQLAPIEEREMMATLTDAEAHMGSEAFHELLFASAAEDPDVMTADWVAREAVVYAR
jgi:tetratricopeptide (TPR) repeat protein